MITIKPYAGWNEVLVLANPAVELFITLEAGPRILRFAHKDGRNIFKEYTEQLGKSGEKTWMIRGGHRLWIAPELDATYHLDNSKVAWTKLSDHSVRLQPEPETSNGWAKEIDITLSPDKSEVQVVHRLKSLKDQPAPVALWALSVMAPGGTAIIPQPPLGSHPKDLLPNRRVVLWPYTEANDPRYKWNNKNMLFSQDAHKGPTKMGLLHQQGKVGYALDGLLFTKTIPFKNGSEYPDFGVNLELFSNEEMLEVESLAPLGLLKKGQVTEHVENWTLQKIGATDWSSACLP